MTGNLQRALHDEEFLYRALLEVCAQKRDALVGLRTGEVERLVAAEEALLTRLGDAASARRREAREASLRLGLPADATLREIAAAARDSGLAELREALSMRAREVARANDLNRALAAQSLDHVRTFLRALAGMEGDGGTYTRRGAEAPAAAAKVNLLDSVA